MVDDPVSELQTEEEQIEQIRKWWQENGTTVMVGVVLGGALLFGWNYWKAYKVRYATQASDLHEQLLTSLASGNNEAFTSLNQQLQSDFGSSPYAEMAPLALAKMHADAGDLDAAANALESATRGDDTVANVARLRLARVRLAQDRPQDALVVLGSGGAGSFAPLFDELRGDAHAALADADAARSAYQSALDSDEVGVDRTYVRIKLDALGPAPDGQ